MIEYTIKADTGADVLATLKQEVERRINATMHRSAGARKKIDSARIGGENAALASLLNMLENTKVEGAAGGKPTLQNDLAQKLEWQSAVGGADEWFANIIHCLERQVEEVKQRRAQFHTAVHASEEDRRLTKPSDTIAWTVSHLISYPVNYRLDMATSHAVRIAKVVG